MSLAMCEYCRFHVAGHEEWVKVNGRLYHMRCWLTQPERSRPSN